MPRPTADAPNGIDVTAEEFRELALALPGCTEGEHRGHADFRVAGRIFATLGPGEAWGMVRLPDATQAALIRRSPQVFEPFAGGWGRQGATRVRLDAATPVVVRRALLAAWREAAPRELVREFFAES